MDSDWAYDRPENLNTHIRLYTEILLIRNGCTLEPVPLPAQVITPFWWRSEKYYSSRGQRSILSEIVKSNLGFDGIYDCLFRQSEPWVVEDFAMSDVWYIAVLVYTDTAFRKVFRDCLHCYRSPFNTLETTTSDHILESTFSIATVVNQVKNASCTERNDFFNTLVVKGTPPMFAPFLNAGIDLDEGGIRDNYLGNACAYGKMSVVDMLLDAGATCARALPKFLKATRFLVTPDLTISKFDTLYSKLLDNIIPPKCMMPRTPEFLDPINAMLGHDLAMETHPDAPKKLLEHCLFEPSLMHGSPYIYLDYSYVFNAVVCNRPKVLAWFLDYGAKPNDIIGDIFTTGVGSLVCLKHYSWLTMAVELGRTACIEVLLEYVEDVSDAVNSRDGAGRSSISHVRSFTGTTYPRVSALQGILIQGVLFENVKVSAAEDASTLTLLEGALGVKSENPPTVDSGLTDEVHQQHTDTTSSIFGRPFTR